MNTTVEMPGYPEDKHPKHIRGQVAQEMAIRHEIGQILAYKMLPVPEHIQEPIFVGPFQEPEGYCTHGLNTHYQIQAAYLPDIDRSYLPAECVKTLAHLLLLRLVNPEVYVEDLADVLCLLPHEDVEKWGGFLSIASAVRIQVLCECEICGGGTENVRTYVAARSSRGTPHERILSAFDAHWMHEKNQDPDKFAPGISHSERPFIQ